LKGNWQELLCKNFPMVIKNILEHMLRIAETGIHMCMGGHGYYYLKKENLQCEN
jgi:hypothetical protein